MIRIVPTRYGERVTTHAYSVAFDMLGPKGTETYLLQFAYSRRQARWVLHVDNAAGERVISGAVVLHGVNLLTYARPELQPRGFLVVVWQTPTDSAPEPEEFTLGKNSQLVYFEREEDLDNTPPTDPVKV